MSGIDVACIVASVSILGIALSVWTSVMRDRRMDSFELEMKARRNEVRRRCGLPEEP